MKKKKKNPYPRSFAKRLTWYIMLTLLVIMGFTSYLIYKLSTAFVLAEAEAFCMELLIGRNEVVQRTLSEVSVASINIVPDIENSLEQPEKLSGIMERMVKLNPRIHSCGTSFVDSYYPQQGRWFCPYAVRDSSGQVKTFSVGDAKHDYLTDEWFLEAKDAKENQWSKPFFNGTDSTTLLTSYMVPIHDKKGSTVAVLGADLSLESLNSKLQKSIRINITGTDSREEKEEHDLPGQDDWKDSSSENDDNYFDIYFFIIDSVGNYIAHPDKGRVMNRNYFTDAQETPDTIDDHVGHKMVAGEQGYIYNDKSENSFFFNIKSSYIFYTNIDNTNWSIGLVVPALFVKIIGYILGGILMALIVIALLVIFFVGRSAIRRAVKPVKLLATSANEVAKGNFDTPLPKVKSRDEIHLLRDSFDEMQHSLTQYVEELKTTTAQKSAIESELKIAHDIQMSMLPKTFPPFPERNDVDVYGTLTPAKGVGGDLFDFYIRDERLFFCIGDVSGKGIPAALLMAVTRSLFRNVSSYATQPDAIAYALNNALADSNETNMFVTLFIGVFDLQTGMLNYCNAGHNAPLLVGRDMGVLPCDPNLPLGVLADFKFQQQEASIDSQTTIFLYTDGLNEAEDTNHAQFGDMRIQQVAKRLLTERQHDPLNIIYEMNEAVHRFVGGAEQSDDLTMLAIQYR